MEEDHVLSIHRYKEGKMGEVRSSHSLTVLRLGGMSHVTQRAGQAYFWTLIDTTD